MEVQNIEVVGALAHTIQHEHVVRDGIAYAGVEPQPQTAAKPRSQWHQIDGATGTRRSWARPGW